MKESVEEPRLKAEKVAEEAKQSILKAKREYESQIRAKQTAVAERYKLENKLRMRLVDVTR